jgi:hypothetical protein
MNGFGAFEGGFTLETVSTTCTFDSFFPVSGSVDMRAGTLYLLKDLLLDKGTSLVSMGDIYGDGHLMECSASVTAMWAPSSITMDNIILALNNDVEWQIQTIFQGTCTVDGHSKKVEIEDSTSIIVASGGHVTFKNMTLDGLKNGSFYCQDGTASIAFKNCELHVDSDFTFSNGSILFDSDVEITGTNQITYSTVNSSTIGLQSKLTINNGMTFYYAPSVANRDLLVMTDKSSILYLDGCTLRSTETGIRLTKGRLFLDNVVTFSCAGSADSESIAFGNGTAADNVDVTFCSGAWLDVYGGMHYDNA